MKKLLLIVSILLILPTTSLASPFLACDIPTTAWTRSEVEVDGVIVEGIMQINIDGTALLLLDLANQPVGQHTFRARFKDAPEWPGP